MWELLVVIKIIVICLWFWVWCFGYCKIYSLCNLRTISVRLYIILFQLKLVSNNIVIERRILLLILHQIKNKQFIKQIVIYLSIEGVDVNDIIRSINKKIKRLRTLFALNPSVAQWGNYKSFDILLIWYLTFLHFCPDLKSETLLLQSLFLMRLLHVARVDVRSSFN